MNNENEQIPGAIQDLGAPVQASYRLSAQYVEEEVAKGRDVDEVLQEELKDPRHAIWFDPEVLRHYSPAVEATFKTSPIPLRMSQKMRLALDAEARKSNLPRSEVMRQLLEESLTERELKSREKRQAEEALDDVKDIVLDWFKADYKNRRARAEKALEAIGAARRRIFWG